MSFLEARIRQMELTDPSDGYGFASGLEIIKPGHVIQTFPWRTQAPRSSKIYQYLQILGPKYRYHQVTVRHPGLRPDVDFFLLDILVILPSAMDKAILPEERLNDQLYAPRIPCPMGESVIPLEFRGGECGLLKEAKMAMVPSIDMWEDILKFGVLYPLEIHGELGMAPYGFGMWVTPVDRKLEVRICKPVSDGEVIDWMQDPDGGGLVSEQEIPDVQLGGAVYVPPGFLVEVKGNLAIGGYVLKYRDIAAWAALLGLQVQYPQSVREVDVTQHAAGFLRAVGYVVDEAERRGDLGKFGGQDIVEGFRTNKKACEELLVNP